MAKKQHFLHGVTTIGERGQIVIPQNIRTALKIKSGDEMVVMTKGERIVVVPARKLEDFYRTMIDHMDDLRKNLKK